MLSYMTELSFYCSIRSTIVEEGDHKQGTTQSDISITVRITNSSGFQ